MKKFAIAIVAFFGLAAAVQAADLSSEMLSKMGLGGMQQLTDAQGMAIRGMGDIIIHGDNRVRQSNRVGINLGQINQQNNSNVNGDQDADGGDGGNGGDAENNAEDNDDEVDQDANGGGGGGGGGASNFSQYNSHNDVDLDIDIDVEVKKSSRRGGGHRGGRGGRH